MTVKEIVEEQNSLTRQGLAKCWGCGQIIASLGIAPFPGEHVCNGVRKFAPYDTAPVRQSNVHTVLNGVLLKAHDEE